MSGGRLGDYLEYQPSQEETVEMTLAFILIDLNGLKPRAGRFTIEQEDQLYAIEQAARELRTFIG